MTKVNTMRNSIFFDFTWLNPRQCHRLTVKFNSETLSRKPNISISISTISISISPHLHLWVLSVSAYTAPAGCHSPVTNLDLEVCIFLFDLQLAPNLFLKTALTSQYETLFLVFLSWNHSDQMSKGSQVTKVTICVQILTWQSVSQSLTHSLTKGT